jgi:Protein of unknown function (DUF3710)
VLGRRKKASTDGAPPQTETVESAPEPEQSAKPPRPNGPWDASEVDLHDSEQLAGRVDLGGLRIKGSGEMQLQMQVEQGTQRVTSVLVVEGDAAVQLLAVAAPRTEAMWPEVRAQIAADAVRRGGSVEEAEGPFGTELRVRVPVQTPDGGQGIQPSRMVGIDGPRWLLRATFLGRAAVDDAAFASLSQVVRDVVVERGSAPMPPGDLIPLHLPQQPSQPGGGEAT